ncbi:hypothetical protein VTI74DRAFT_8928 [Chaetomium olivicolor]
MPGPIAHIVYQGVNGKYEGTLFNGVKFWVAQRVPSRRELLEKIKDNGGKIVELDKFGDVLVADDLRKNVKHAPPNSVSRKYVDDCVAKGELVNIEDYRIHQSNEPRPVGSNKPAKGTKVPFTRRDEQILVTFVREKEKDGERIQGNKIYQELEERVRYLGPGILLAYRLTSFSIRTIPGSPGGTNGSRASPCFLSASYHLSFRNSRLQPQQRPAYPSPPGQPIPRLKSHEQPGPSPKSHEYPGPHPAPSRHQLPRRPRCPLPRKTTNFSSAMSRIVPGRVSGPTAIRFIKNSRSSTRTTQCTRGVSDTYDT